MEEENLKKDPSDEEGEPIEEEDAKEDPSEDEEEPMEEDDFTKGEVEFIENDDLVEEPAGNEDKGLELAEGRSEPETMMFPWGRKRCGRMCRGMCPLDAPSQ